MKCEGCRAEIMLGSAQCERCGRSVLDVGPGPSTGAAGRSRLPLPPPSPSPQPSLPLPPPPPPFGTPPAQGPRPGPAARRAAQPGGQSQVKGCGCGALVWLIALFTIGSAVAGVVAARNADSDSDADPFESSATTSFSPIDLRDFEGPTSAGPPVGPGASTVHDLEGGTIAVHPLRCEQACTIAVSPIEGFDPVIRVVGPGGAVLGEDDDGGDGLGSLLALVATPAPGTELQVIDFSGDPGSYSVLVTPTVG